MRAATVTDFRLRTPATTSRAYAWMAVVAVAAFVLLGAGPVGHRGPWLDEFWTLWLSRHDVGLSETFWQRWMADLHPPLFSFVHWLAEPWSGDSYVRHRMLNLVPLAWCALFVGLVLRRHPGAGPMVCVFLVSWLSLPITLEYFAEMRSYFAQMSLLFCLVGSIMVVQLGDRDLDRGQDLPLLAFTGVTVLVVLNLNYLTTAMGCMLIALAVLGFALGGKRRWAATMALMMVVALVPAVGFLLIQLETLRDASGNYWVTGTIWEAMLTMRRVLRRAVSGNPVALLAAGIVLAGALLSLLRGRFAETGRMGWLRTALVDLLPGRAQWRLVVLLALAAAGFAALMLLAHLRQPIVTGRYLLGWQVLLVSVVAALGAQVVARHWLWGVVMLLVGFAGQYATSQQVAAEARWLSSFELLQREVGQCQSAEVFAAEFPRQSIMPNETEVRRFAQERMALWHGITARFVEPRPPRFPARAGQCPALVWVEHVNWNVMPRDASPATMLSRIGFEPEPFDVERARAAVGDTGFVLILPVKP